LNVEITSVQQQASLRASLAYDKDRRGGYGRTLQADYPELSLLKHDRLEPTTSLSNVADFDSERVPFPMTFWRRSKETLCRHRNPMLGTARTGISIHNVGIDWMHTLSLGVAQFLLGHLFWALVAVNFFQVAGTAPNVLELTVVRFREALFVWYDAEQRHGRKHTRVQQLTVGMFVSHGDPSCKLHGSETNGVLWFALSLLRDQGSKLGTAKKHAYEEAVSSLTGLIELIKQHPRAMPATAQQAFVRHVSSHMCAINVLGVAKRPKHHYLIEMAAKRLGRILSALHVVCTRMLRFGVGLVLWIASFCLHCCRACDSTLSCFVVLRRKKNTHIARRRLHWLGSPGWTAVWKDEAANLDLKRLCQAAHQSHWHGRILASSASLREFSEKRRRYS
jgi:hypothetical protein